ncbi:tyrosine-type recombinase/integrase [Treponema sp. OMZ 799]|uniref:tyrosine-type recombinase/integrase n=1 Tax=Treponema sp. OMZ 799 TaxID=2563668 RepID=UPI0020A358E4|nr:tyrosine-type recombinase/integrase [Treponema sp. OMZ 799]UTC77057.1 tyrosine-type recombinase/integrase [Treponema sp. OMZ 799]UTC78242.1 tyrosine-type recombinase/integrase [Treponema sp. OMZ 799]
MKNRCQFYYYQKPSGIYYCQPISPTTGKKLFTRSTGTKDYDEAMRIINEWLVLGFPEKNKKKTVQTVDVFKNLTSLIYDNKIDVEDGLNAFFVFLNSYKEKFSSKQASSFLQTAATILDIQLNPSENTKKDSIEVKFVDYLLGFWNYDSSPYILKLINTGTPSDELPQRKRFNCIHSWLKKYISYFDDKEFYLSDITANDINAFFAYIISLDTMTVSSLSIFSSAIKQACKFAEDENLIKNHIVKDIKQYSIEKYRKNILEKEEAETLFSSVNNFKNLEHYCINRLAIESVSRIGELQAIQLKDISITKNNKGIIDCWITISKTWDKTTHKLKKTKNKTSKTVKISNEMYLYLEKLIEQNPFKNDKNAFLFYHPEKKEIPITYSVITREFKKALQTLGFLRDGITFHSYRHLGVVILADNNYSPREIMLLTGHKTPDMVNFYANHKTKVQETKKQDMSNILCNFLEKKNNLGLDKKNIMF